MSNSASNSPPPDDADAPGYVLQPVSRQTEEQLRQTRQSAVAANQRLNASPPITMPPPDEESQLTLAGMLTMMALVSISLAIGRLFPPAIFAGVCGFIAVLYPLVLPIWLGESASERFWQQIWWSLLIVYLLAIILAIVRSGPD